MTGQTTHHISPIRVIEDWNLFAAARHPSGNVVCSKWTKGINATKDGNQPALRRSHWISVMGKEDLSLHAVSVSDHKFGAEKRTRTSTPLRERGPEPRASANSAISAHSKPRCALATREALVFQSAHLMSNQSLGYTLRILYTGPLVSST